MDQLEAIALAVEVMKRQPMANTVDLARARAKFVKGTEVMEDLRRQWPEANLEFSLENYWLVQFPLIVPDVYQRDWLRVKVDPSTKTAEIVLDL